MFKLIPVCNCNGALKEQRCALFRYNSSNSKGWLDIDKDEISISVEPEVHDARIEALSPLLFDENIRIAQFICDGHLQPELVNSAIENKFDALLFHGTGLGHLPISDPEGDSIENAKLRLILEDFCAEDGIAVVVAQTINGPINLNVYSKGREQQEIGIIGHGSLCPPESALII